MTTSLSARVAVSCGVVRHGDDRAPPRLQLRDHLVDALRHGENRWTASARRGRRGGAPSTSARRNEAIFFSPPESAAGLCDAASSRPARSRARTTRRSTSARGELGEMDLQGQGKVLEQGLVLPERPVLEDEAIHLRASPHGLARRGGRCPGPLKRTLPESGGISPAATFRSVLLPQPDGPMMTVLCPSGKETVTPRRAS